MKNLQSRFWIVIALLPLIAWCALRTERFYTFRQNVDERLQTINERFEARNSADFPQTGSYRQDAYRDSQERRRTEFAFREVDEVVNYLYERGMSRGDSAVWFHRSHDRLEPAYDGLCEKRAALAVWMGRAFEVHAPFSNRIIQRLQLAGYEGAAPNISVMPYNQAFAWSGLASLLFAVALLGLRTFLRRKTRP